MQRGAHALPLAIDLGLKVAKQLVALAGQVLIEQGLRVAPRHEHAGTQHLRREARAEQGGAVEARTEKSAGRDDGGEKQE